MKITNIKSGWTEKGSFSLERADTGNEYIFIHFISPAVLHTDYCDIRAQHGACVLYDKHTRQHFSALNESATYDMFHLKGDLTELMEKYDLCFNQVYYPINSFAVTEIVRGMEREFMQPNAFSEDYYTAKITELLLNLARNTLHPSEKQIDAETRLLFEHIRKTMLDCYDKCQNTEDMAKYAHMKRTVFYDTYKQLFGISPKQDLISCRIEHAKHMLLNRKHSVEQVAKLCGYTNTSHFVRQFKAKTGATPSKFICL